MVSVNQMSFYFGGQDIFEEISFQINARDRIGLVGRNGAGKTTLLNLLSKKISPKSGSIDFINNINIGYLPQDLDFVNDSNLLDEFKKAFNEIQSIERRIEQINHLLSTSKDFESKEYLENLDKLSDLQQELNLLGVDKISSEIATVSKGLGFKTTDFERNTDEFSGGWRMRIELVKILLRKPDVLLLDEPTNHLDIESIIWLEKWLKNYSGAIVMVSHDKFFIDNVTNRTIEISFSSISDYKSNYSKYLKLREDRIEKQIQSKKNQEKFVKQTTDLINKFRAKKNKAKFAKSLQTKLDKLEIVKIDENDTSKIKLKFPKAQRSGKVTVKLIDVSKSYSDKLVLENINFELTRGDKVAFVGKNGEGKTTLAKIISNTLDFEGELKIGYNVTIGYYAQDQADYLDNEKTVLETVEYARGYDSSMNARTILGSFLFSDDDVFKKIKVLSGGERARVSLCRLLNDSHNFLIMDEPTNHLDIHSKELLKKALIEFDGTLIIVSHDRDFLSNLTTKVYEFSSKKIKEHRGDINSFLQNKKLSNVRQYENSTNNVIAKKENNDKKKSYHQIKKIEKQKKIILRRIKRTEDEIESLASQLSLIEKKIQENQNNFSKKIEGEEYVNYEKIKQKIKSLEEKWTLLLDDLGETS